MQKLILGRTLESNPRIILANQPVRGLDIGAVTYVQKRLIAARDAGAAILLISEDLDEIHGTWRMSFGSCPKAVCRQNLYARIDFGSLSLGKWMAGRRV